MSSDESPSPPPATPGDVSTNATPSDNRFDLIAKARAFLHSPTIRYDNDDAKRRFLADKGLNAAEIDNLLKETPRQSPPIPPRSYPLAPPSNLPYLLISLLQIFTWGVGVSGALVVFYYRFLLPRISRSLAARHKLVLHQTGLVSRLEFLLKEFKTMQQDTFDALPPPQPDVFPPTIKGLEDIPVDASGIPSQPLGILLRAVFLAEPGQEYTVNMIYARLVKLFPAFADTDANEFMRAISRQLSRSGLFIKRTEGEVERWSLRADTNSNAIPVISSTPSILEALRNAIVAGTDIGGAYQYTFKALTDLTAFLSKETFDLYSTATGFRRSFAGVHNLSPIQEDVRREIRALKGLVLNRRSFVPAPNRIGSPSSTEPPTRV